MDCFQRSVVNVSEPWMLRVTGVPVPDGGWGTRGNGGTGQRAWSSGTPWHGSGCPCPTVPLLALLYHCWALLYHCWATLGPTLGHPWTQSGLICTQSGLILPSFWTLFRDFDQFLDTFSWFSWNFMNFPFWTRGNVKFHEFSHFGHSETSISPVLVEGFGEVRQKSGISRKTVVFTEKLRKVLKSVSESATNLRFAKSRF